MANISISSVECLVERLPIQARYMPFRPARLAYTMCGMVHSTQYHGSWKPLSEP